MPTFSSRYSRAVLICATLVCAAVNPAYAADNAPTLDYPADYRSWIFLTSGLDMTYSAGAAADHHMFDNVFVNPQAYNAFKATGRWPDKTILVKEARGGQSKGSINQGGMFQQGEVMALEVHAKDEKRFPGQWAFFAFGDTKPAQAISRGASCYTCHEAHGAVDTTFVQFYPTLLPIAEARKTLSPNTLIEASATQK
jgi:hypothetical protein